MDWFKIVMFMLGYVLMILGIILVILLVGASIIMWG